MINQDQLIKIHIKLEEQRRLERISYDKMASVIGYSGNGLKKALNNSTLSIPQINSIITEFGLESSFIELNAIYDGKENQKPNNKDMEDS